MNDVEANNGLRNEKTDEKPDFALWFSNINRSSRETRLSFTTSVKDSAETEIDRRRV